MESLIVQDTSTETLFFKRQPDLPMISLLVAAWNEEKYIETFLESYAALDYPSKELVLCAGGEDQTYHIVQQWAQQHEDLSITTLEQQIGEGKFRALRRCLISSTGSIIVLTDADCRLNASSLKHLCEPIISGVASLATGVIRPLVEQKNRPFVQSQWLIMQNGIAKSLEQAERSSFLIGQYSAIERSIVEKAYAATDRDMIGEDTYLALFATRLGYSILRLPESYVETKFAETIVQYVQQRSRWRRDQLIHRYNYGGERTILLKGFLSICKHAIWLLLPLLTFPLGLIGVVLWIFSWGARLVGYRRQYIRGTNSILVDKHNTSSEKIVVSASMSAIPLWSLFKLMLADSLAVLHLWVHMVIPKWRHRW